MQSGSCGATTLPAERLPFLSLGEGGYIVWGRIDTGDPHCESLAGGKFFLVQKVVPFLPKNKKDLA